jgi:hypothetical protein
MRIEEKLWAARGRAAGGGAAGRRAAGASKSSVE